MEPNILSIIIGVAALVVGIILGKFIFAKNTQKAIQEAEAQAQKLIADGQLQAETLKKEKPRNETTPTQLQQEDDQHLKPRGFKPR